MSQSEQFGEAWGHIRDNARPVIADDVYFLDEARADMPPSKAHLRRLARSRPTVTTPTPWGTSSALARRRANVSTWSRKVPARARLRGPTRGWPRAARI